MHESELSSTAQLSGLEDWYVHTSMIHFGLRISVLFFETYLPTIGVFNISNKLLVSLDILLRMREHIQKGEPPGNCAEAEVRSKLQMPHAPELPEEQVRYLIEKLYNGFFAFEALTDRDWDSGVCGICGVCPLFESGDGNCKNCTPLTNGMVNY